MLFRNVKVAQIFKYCDNLWMKFHTTTAINLTVDAEGKAIGWPVEFDLDTEVELITKCKNCKHWDAGYCEKNDLVLLDDDMSELLHPETFVCGEFENKINGKGKDK